MANKFLNDIEFPTGVSFRLKIRRTIVDYICVDKEDSWFYEIRHHKKGVVPEQGPWTIRKDLAGSMRMYAGYQEEGLTVSNLETGEVIFKGPDKPKKSKK